MTRRKKKKGPEQTKCKCDYEIAKKFFIRAGSFECAERKLNQIRSFSDKVKANRIVL